MEILTKEQLKSRHPKIQYWFWDKPLLKSQAFKEQLDLLCEKSDFNTVILTERDGVNFWEEDMKPYFDKAIKLAHERGLKIMLQLWPRGHYHKTEVSLKDAVALATEREGVITNGKLTLNSLCTSVRWEEAAPSIHNKILKAYAFKKTGEGFHEENSLVDIAGKAVITENGKSTLTAEFNCPELEGYTVYMLTAHYYQCADMFSQKRKDEFKEIIDFYKDSGFDSVVLDEFKNLTINPPWVSDIFHDRFYGDSFKAYFEEKTGKDLDQVLFEMRYCPENKENVRMSAINIYFDIFRHSTKIVETFVADYTKKTFGKDAFDGLHNTYHNWLQNDEIWMTCCNWWEVPRNYAQTDEDICYPIRLGIACGCKESLIFDMYYHKDPQAFADKVMRDAAFGSRLHYHAMNDLYYGVDTGSAEFLDFIKPVEDKITLLNAFDPNGLPKMELLVVFGFPSLCNWYPDKEARSGFDINKKLVIEKRCIDLWNNGFFNALAPSDAIDDGRITRDADGKFDYCGHKFDKMLYLYPEYAKDKTIAALKNFATADNFAVIGSLTHDFDGNKVDGGFLEDSTLPDDADIAKEMSLTKNKYDGGCLLEDGSVVIADVGYSQKQEEKTVCFTVNGHSVNATYKGVFAIKLKDNGEIEKAACGDCALLEVNGEKIAIPHRPQDILICEK
ncbi:MAG: hypothetical protein E7548_05965 [Ruminococcaceae bacterium]|nr:hypothetical protein [Oscillospiraceae bacterium]